MVINIFYNAFIGIYHFAIRLASLWNHKAKLWIAGRKNFFPALQTQLSLLPNDKQPRIWMHASSLGEFEQGRPLIEDIRKKYPKCQVIISFFSPSGYEVRKNYKGADLVLYLPIDTTSNARRFIDAIKPTLVLWIRYEFWLHYLEELKKRNIPLLLVSANLRKKGIFKNVYNYYRKRLFSTFTHLFVQTKESEQLLKEMGFTQNVSISGDTRFDRVIDIAGKFEDIPLVKNFCGAHKVIVAGSTWSDDEEVLIHYAKIKHDIKFIIAPHEVDKENVEDLQKEFPDSILFSKLKANENNLEQLYDDNIINTLIIDNIGMLSKLYHYADITYVGGGFSDGGLHNILEAAVYGKPVFFGPLFEKNYEAAEMIEEDGAISIENALELENELNNFFTNYDELKKCGEEAKNYVYKNAGATARILDYIYKNRLLTN
ncbi:MAG: glycosyltransferase N-terminal domain-containing protein [Agriterribacter sp.]